MLGGHAGGLGIGFGVAARHVEVGWAGGAVTLPSCGRASASKGSEMRYRRRVAPRILISLLDAGMIGTGTGSSEGYSRLHLKALAKWCSAANDMVINIARAYTD